MKNLTYLLLGILLSLFFATPAFAQSVTPQTYTSIYDTVDIQLGTAEAWALYYANGTQAASAIYSDSNSIYYFAGSAFLGETFHILFLNNTDTGSCYDSGIDYAECLATHSSEIVANVALTYHAGFPSDSAWTGLFAGGNQTGSSSEMLANVADSVASTGGNIWPLLALTGIPLAFFIAYELVRFIRRSAGEPVYYRARAGDKMEPMADQELGREAYNLQERGTTDLP